MNTDDIVAAFLNSGCHSGQYAHWPLDRQLCVFLSARRAMAWVFTDDAAYNTIYAEILTLRRRNGSANRDLPKLSGGHQRDASDSTNPRR